MIVVGLDLSLSCTGLARVQSDGTIETFKIKPPAKLRDIDRLSWIRHQVLYLSQNAGWVVVEGPAFGAQGGQQGHHERAGLFWMVADSLRELPLMASESPVARIVVPPTSLKKYMTGKGNASKDQVLAAVINRFREVPVDDNNVADALSLAAMGRDAQGQPLVAMPQLNRDALKKVNWPGVSQMTPLVDSSTS